MKLFPLFKAKVEMTKKLLFDLENLLPFGYPSGNVSLLALTKGKMLTLQEEGFVGF